MALINCPECGKEISDSSKKCIHCGYVLDKDGEKKKKILIVVVAIVIVIAIIAAIIGSNSKGNSTNKHTNSNSTDTAANETSNNESDNQSGGFDADKTETITFSRNQTVNTDNADFTLLGYEIDSVIEPSNPPDYYHYYEADSGNVYVDVKFDMKNTASSAVMQDEIVKSVTVIYDDNYEYRCSFVTVDSDGDFEGYTSIYSINPLETKEYHCIAKVSDEVQSSGKPLKVQVEADGNIYECTLR